MFKKSNRGLLIVVLIGVAIIIGFASNAISTSPPKSSSIQPIIMNYDDALKLPKPTADCNDQLPNGIQKDFVNNTLHASVHWTGCYTFVHGINGAAIHSSDGKGGIIFNRVLIPVDVSEDVLKIMWVKETFGNANASLFSPSFGNTLTVDGMASLFLTPEEQKTMGFRYPSQNKIFDGQYVQWIPQDEAASDYDCTIFLAIHYLSIDGNLGTNNGGIENLFQPGQPLAPCQKYLLNP